MIMMPMGLCCLILPVFCMIFVIAIMIIPALGVTHFLAVLVFYFNTVVGGCKGAGPT